MIVHGYQFLPDDSWLLLLLAALASEVDDVEGGGT
jgi:hypothetical protein